MVQVPSLPHRAEHFDAPTAKHRALPELSTVRLARRGWAGVVWVVLAGACGVNQQAHAAMLRTTGVPLSVPLLAAGDVFAAFVTVGLWWLPRRTAAPCSASAGSPVNARPDPPRTT
jgi:hypothetical protein